MTVGLFRFVGNSNSYATVYQNHAPAQRANPLPPLGLQTRQTRFALLARKLHLFPYHRSKTPRANQSNTPIMEQSYEMVVMAQPNNDQMVATSSRFHRTHRANRLTLLHIYLFIYLLAQQLLYYKSERREFAACNL